MKYALFITAVFLLFLLFKNNKDVEGEESGVYLGETTIEYVFEHNDEINLKGEIVRGENERAVYACQLIKIDPFINCYNSNKFLTQQLLAAIKEESLHVWEVNDASKRITYEDIAANYFQIDTITYFDGETYEEHQKYIRSTPSQIINSYKIKQNWFFDAHQKRLSNEVVEIIPIAWLRNKEGEIVNKEVGRIINNKTNTNTSTIINNENNIWIKKTSDELAFATLNLQNEPFEKAMQEVLLAMPLSGRTIAYRSENKLNCLDKMSVTHLKKCLNEVSDTSMIYKEETMEEYIRIDTRKIRQFDDFQGLGISQLWYFDAKSKSLNSRLIGIAPLIAKKDHFSGASYYQELYQVKF